MQKPPLALQLYSVRTETKVDFARTVATVARIGYHGVELAGYGNLDAAGAKDALDKAGLRVAGMHVGISALRTDLNAVINDALKFGTKHVICPHWVPVQFTSPGACEKIGEQLAQIGATLRAFGLQLSFHNHAAEMTLLEGRTVLEWILGAAAPRDLGAELDVYWAHQGGQSPVQLLRGLGSRCELVHLKDEAELGRGPVDFGSVFAAIDSIGAAEWLVVEQEKGELPPLESARLNFSQLQHWGRT